MTIKAIQTEYNGYRFRSRLEARWAVFFDSIGLRYDYEPEGFELDGGLHHIEPAFDIKEDGSVYPYAIINKLKKTYYLPDFVTYWPNGKYYVEIKPPSYTLDELAKCLHFAAATQQNIMLLCGYPGLPKFKHDDKKNGWDLADGYYGISITAAIMETKKTPILKHGPVPGYHFVFDPVTNIYLSFCDNQLHVFSTNGHDGDLDYWPVYLKYKKINDNNFIFGGDEIPLSSGKGKHCSPMLNGYYTMRGYIGAGRLYKDCVMSNAYKMARGARFEHGENGANHAG